MSGWLSDLLLQPGFDLGSANLQKFLMRNLLESRIRELRRVAVQRAFQQTLFGDDPAECVTLTIKYPYDSRPEVYALAAITTAVMEYIRFVNISTAESVTLTARKNLSV